jgi:hypothetical protein
MHLSWIKKGIKRRGERENKEKKTQQIYLIA